ncbi:MAG: BatD family protein [Saprospiraceae bacterium]
MNQIASVNFSTHDCADAPQARIPANSHPVRVAAPWLCLLFFPFQIWAQQPQFTAKVESPQVAVGTNFEVVFELKNGEGRQFRPPTFNGFKKLAGPSTQTSVTIVNGKYSQSMGWTFILQAVQPGMFTIGEASVSVGSQLVRTQPITVEVVPARGGAASGPKINAAPGAGGSDELFVAAEIADGSLYVGQQTVVNFTLYTRVGVESYDILLDPTFDGFFAKDLTRFDTRTRQVTIRGSNYMARILRSVALFPQQSGTLTIGAMRFQFGTTPPGAPRDPFSAFFGRNVVPVTVETQPVSVRVKPLPEPVPANFTGGVGQYDWTIEANKTELTTDDALTLRMTVRGNGDGKRFAPPQLNLPPELEAYEPKTAEEETYENGDQLIHAKVLEYAILPKQPGTFALRPELVFFDPDSNRYVSKKVANPLTINVSQGTGARQGDPSGTASQLRPSKKIMPQMGLLSAFGLALLGLLAVSVGVFFWRKKQRQKPIERSIVAPEVQAKMKVDLAREHLAHARKLMQENQPRAFYDEILKAMHGYLAVKLDAPQSDLTQAALRQKLTERRVSPETLDALGGVLQACEIALFAGQPDPTRMAEVYQKSEDTMRRLEEELK